MKNKPYVIAEMACSHEGDPALARIIIDGASRAKADAIQFQIWRYADVDVPGLPDAEERKRVEMSRETWSRLAAYVRAEHPELDIVACVSDCETVDFCEAIEVDAYKIHSSDLSNPFLIGRTAETGRRIDLSVGASTLEEIRNAMEWIRETSRSTIWLMYGIQTFPTASDEIHLRIMSKLQDLFEVPVGYQDHTNPESAASFWLPAAAFGLGVRIHEKHLTHNRALRGVDYQAALNPDEFSNFVMMLATLESAMGSSLPRPFSATEKKYRRYSKKSLVVSRDMKAGRVVAEDDMRIMRARDLGLPPDRFYSVLGKSINRDLCRFATLTEDVLA